MKMNSIKLFILVLACTTVLAIGCSTGQNNSSIDNTTDNPFEISDNEDGDQIESAYSLRLLTRTLTYKGSPLELYYEIENSDVSNELGIMLYIDGILQKYHTDENDAEDYMHTRQFEENEKVKIKMYIDPSVGTKGQTLYLSIVTILNPHFQPKINSPVYGHNFNCSTATFAPIEYQVNSKQERIDSLQDVHIEDIPKEIKDNDEMIGGAFNNTATLKMKGSDISEDSYPRIIVGDNYKLTIVGRGGVEKVYRIYLFCGTQPYVLPGGLEYIEFPIKVDKMSSVDVEMDFSNKTKGDTTTVYAVAIPLVENENDWSALSMQTEPYLFIKK